MGNKEIYTAITEKFLSALKSGISPWKSAEIKSGRPINMVTGNQYKGINWLVLSLQAHASSLYCTYLQAQTMGLFVRQGEKAKALMKFNFVYIHKKTKAKISEPKYNSLSDAEQREYDKIPFVNTFSVFNLDQLDGDHEKVNELKTKNQKDISFEVLIGGYLETENIRVDHKGVDRSGSYGESIVMPNKYQFENALAYYSILCASVVGSTSSKLKWGRDESFNKLVSCIGSAFLCEIAGKSTEYILSDDKSWFADWIFQMEANPKYLIDAAKAAQQAVDLINERIDIRMAFPEFYSEEVNFIAA